jgi:DNA invertase Pin-like site-specific DNA recombinase
MTSTTVRTMTAREYLRVSGDKSGDGHSPDQQHTDNEAAAVLAGWSLGQPYRELTAVSASKYSTKARPAWDAMMADLTADRFDADIAILWESSRGSRRMTTWAPFIEACERSLTPAGTRGVLIHVTSHGRTYDPRNARDVRSLLEDGVDSQYESAKTAGRVKRGMDASRAAGQPHGRPPFGYRRTDPGPATGHPHEYPLHNARGAYVRQVEEPAEAAAVRMIYRARRAGQSWRSIAATLAAGDVPARAGDWTASRVREIADNPSYIARRLHTPGNRSGHRPDYGPADLAPGLWPALVSEDDFWAVKSSMVPRQAPGGQGRTPQHLLSMIATCGKCGGPVSVRYTHNGRTPRYTGRNCGHVTVNRDPADAYVTAAVLALMTDPGAYAMLTADPAASADLAAARDTLATARAEHDELGRMVGAGKLSAILAASAEPAILARIDAAAAAVRALSAPSGLAGLGLAPGADFASRWDAALMTARRAVVRSLFAGVTIAPAGRDYSGPVADRITITRL